MEGLAITFGRGFPSGGRQDSNVCCSSSTLTATGSLSKRLFKSEKKKKVSALICI